MIEKFAIKIDGLEERIARLEEAEERSTDLTPVWQWAHQVLLLLQAQQFLTQGAYLTGSQWQPIKAATLARKIRVFGTPPTPLGILYASGALFESLTNEGSGDHVFQASPQSMIMGSRVFYGVYHQDGAPPYLPQRRIIGFTDRFKRLLFRTTVTYILAGTIPPAGMSGL